MAISQTVGLVRFPLFWVIGIVCVRLAFSAGAELAPANLGAAVSSPVSGRGSMSAVATETPENNQLPPKTQALENTGTGVTLTAIDPAKTDKQIPGLKPNPTASIGVIIVGGLGLFLWVWRLRNFSA